LFLRTAFLACLSAIMTAQEQPAAQSSAPSNASSNAELQISGILVSSTTGQPVANGKIGITSAGNREDFSVVVTGLDGKFSFRKLAPGKYAVRAEHRGYVPQFFDQHEGFSSSVVVGQGLDSTGLVFRLSPESAISGTITDEAGEPVRNAQVTLYRSGIFSGVQDTRPLANAVTNDEGFYRFAHLPAGRYMVVTTAQVWYAQRPNNQSHRKRVSATPPPDSRSDVLAENQESDGPSPLDVAYPVTFYPGTADPSYATTISLTPGENFVADMTLQPVKALRVELPHAAKQAEQPYVMMLQQKIAGFDITVPTEMQIHSDGSREIVGLVPGRYSLTLGAVGPQKFTQREIVMGSEGVVSSDEGSARVSVALELDAGTERPADAIFELSQPPHRHFNEQIPAKGDVEFRESVPLGKYELSISNASGYYLRSFTGTGARITGRTLEIKSAEPVKLKVVLSRGQGHVTGTVSREGKPVSGAMVVLVPSNPGNNSVLFRREESNSDGSFSISSVVPGRYMAVAIENGWDLEWLDPRVLKPYLAQGVAVDVGPSGKYEVKLNVQ